MNKNKGFTLTELLAVIVILTVLSLIVIPIVNDQVNKSKQKAFETSVDAVKRAVVYYMDQKELNGENNSYIYNVDVKDLKLSNNETLKGNVVITRTDIGYNVKYNGLTDGKFTYYGKDGDGEVYKQSDVEEAIKTPVNSEETGDSSESNDSSSSIFTDPILTTTDDTIVINECYKIIHVVGDLTDLETKLKILGGEIELVPNSSGYYTFGAKLNVKKNGEVVDTYSIIIANGDINEDYVVDALDAMIGELCFTGNVPIPTTCVTNSEEQVELKCLVADFNYDMIVTEEERQKIGEIGVSDCRIIDPVTGRTSC